MKVAFVTMDVESFYDTSCIKDKGIQGNVTCAEQVDEFLSFLNEYNIKATLFVTVDFIKECKDALLRAIRDGHEIALHALVHETPKNYSADYFEECIARAKAIIFQELGVVVKGYRAPCFGIDEAKLEVLKKQGFVYDSSAHNQRTPYGGGRLNVGKFRKLNDSVYRDGSLFEVRPTTLSGGGYIRLLPWWMTKRRLDRCFKRVDSYVFYTHPFEIYQGQFPQMRGLSAVERMFVNRGRKDYLRKIRYIFEQLQLNGFAFTTVSDYLEKLI